MERTINLLDFCKRYPGALQAIISPAFFGGCVEAVENGTINRYGFRKIIEQYLDNLIAVGIIDGKPMGLWKKS